MGHGLLLQQNRPATRWIPATKISLARKDRDLSPFHPADLTAGHLFPHSDGELSWRMTNGREGPMAIMPCGNSAISWTKINAGVSAHKTDLAVTLQGQSPQALPSDTGNMTSKPFSKVA